MSDPARSAASWARYSVISCAICTNVAHTCIRNGQARKSTGRNGERTGRNGKGAERQGKECAGTGTGRQGKELVCASFCSTLAQRHKDELTLLFAIVIVKFPLVRYTHTCTYKYADCLVRTQNGSGSVMTPSLMKVSSLYREDYCAHDRIVICGVSTR